MAATYDTATNVGKVRLLIGDTDIGSAKFSDAEIEVFLSMGSDNIKLAAAYALDSWAASLAREMSGESIGDYTYKRGSVANMKSLAKQYRDEAKGTPAIAWAEPDFESIGDIGDV